MSSKKKPTSDAGDNHADLIDRHEAARRLSISVRTLDELIASGDLAVVRIGRTVRIRPSAITAFVEARETRARTREAKPKAVKKRKEIVQDDLPKGETVEAVDEKIVVPPEKPASAPSGARWLTLSNAATYSSLSERFLEDLAKSGQITTSHVIQNGKKRGRVLVSVESLDALILAGVGREVNLAVNANNPNRKTR